jgi:endogenous inhibitor of DNA gyrase (YacG/DUF329 family)
LSARARARSSTAPQRQARKKTKTCPICGKPLSGTSLGDKPLGDKPQDETYRPFCSKRCADIDLSRWLDGRYAIPGAPADKADDEDEDDRGPG